MIYQPPSDSVSGTVIWTSARGLSVRGGEPDVPGSWHHHVGHDATLETAHPVGEDDGRDAAQGLEALGQEAQGRCLILAAGEPHEADPTPGEDGTEDVETALGSPVDDEVFARDGLPWSVCPAIAPPGRLGAGHRSAQVAGRARVTGRPADGPEALGADPAVSRADPLGDQRREPVGVPWPWRPIDRRPRPALDDPADGLVGRPVQCRRGAVRGSLLRDTPESDQKGLRKFDDLCAGLFGFPN